LLRDIAALRLCLGRQGGATLVAMMETTHFGNGDDATGFR
jgi:hypothetical protein